MERERETGRERKESPVTGTTVNLKDNTILRARITSFRNQSHNPWLFLPLLSLSLSLSRSFFHTHIHTHTTQALTRFPLLWSSATNNPTRGGKRARKREKEKERESLWVVRETKRAAGPPGKAVSSKTVGPEKCSLVCRTLDALTGRKTFWPLFHSLKAD